MYHFIVTLQNYLTNQISDVSWNEFQQQLATAESFEDVIDVHNRYLDAMITRCMLNEPAKPIQVTLDRIFAAVHHFHEQVDQYLKTEARPTQERNTTLVMYIQSTKLEFRQCTKFLFTIVSALSSRGYKYDLTDLLVNLNYNSHYDRLTIK
jgi:lysyl-tRNA synthetase class I